MQFKVSIKYSSNNSDPQKEYTQLFYFIMPNISNIPPQTVGLKLVVLNESYISLISRRNNPGVMMILNNSIINNDLPLNKYKFKIMHKRNCQSNKISYYISFTPYYI